MEQALLLKQFRVLDPSSPWHDQVVDILVDQGRIDEIAPSLQVPAAQVLESNGGVVSQGWVDGQVHFREPGEETKEGLAHGLKVAAAAGMTQVALLPSTHPPVDHAMAVESLLAKGSKAQASGCPTVVLPMGCVTEQGQGQQLSEMSDMAQHGAVAFTDDVPMDRVSALQRALTYSKAHGKTVMDLPLESDLNHGGVMHEGLVSTEMGLLGIPVEAEVLRVSRNLEVLRHAGGRLHFSIVTAAQSVDLIREAKAQGLAVTCGTTAGHLVYTEEDLRGFHGTLKVLAPFRTASDRRALRKSVLDGTIDMVVSDHRPEDMEHHDVEFVLSPNGMACLSSAFALTLHGLRQETTQTEAHDAAVRAWSAGPREVLGLAPAPITVGGKADLTWHAPEASHHVEVPTKAANTPPLPEGLKCTVRGVIHGTKHWLAQA
jgi:dihydroorotase